MYIIIHLTLVKPNKIELFINNKKKTTIYEAQTEYKHWKTEHKTKRKINYKNSTKHDSW